MSAPRAEQDKAQQRLLWLLLLLAGALSVLAARRPPGRPAPPVAADPMRAVPDGAELLLSIELQRLGEVFGRELLRLGGEQLLGLRQTCGFEPLLGLRRVVLAVPARERAQSTPDFALIADTSLAPEDLLTCASAVIAKRGGHPERTRAGAFWSVRDRSKPLGGVAARADGLFVLSGGRYFAEVLAKAQGSAPPSSEGARIRAEVHGALRKKLGPAELLLTLLPGDLLSVPELRAAGLALRVERDAELHGMVACATMADCQNVAGLLERAKPALAAEPDLAPLASVTVLQRAEELELSGRLRRAQLAPLLRALVGASAP